MVFVHWAIIDEFDKEFVNWERVCLLFHNNPSLCQVRDEHDMFPLHYACYRNAPLWAIKFFVRIWPEAMAKFVTLADNSAGVIDSDVTALEIACDVNAPDETISYLAATTRQLGLTIPKWPGEFLMEMNRNIDVVKTVTDENEWTWCEHIFRPQKGDRSYDKRALYRLRNDDPDLVEQRVGWPIASETELYAFVQALSCNNTVERLDIRDGDRNLYSHLLALDDEAPWWSGKQQVIMELLKSALEKNTSIKEIRLKHLLFANDITIHHFVDITKCSHQLERVYFQLFTITKANMSHILTQLVVKEVIFFRCSISEEVAQVAVDTLKQFDHPFHEIKLFETKPYKWNGRWRNPKDYWADYEREWKQRISGDIQLLTWRNRFENDRNQLIDFLAWDASDDTKLNVMYRESCLPVYELDTLHWTDDQKLWYAFILAAIRYDKDHEDVLGCGGPNMLYSLIKKFPEYLKVV